MPGDEIVEFVGQSTGARHVRHRSWSVQFAQNNVVQHPTSITNSETSRFDATNGGRSNESNILGLSGMNQSPCLRFGHTFGNNGNGPNLRCKFECFQYAPIHGSTRGKIHQNGHFGMLRKSFAGGLIDRDKDFIGTPIKFDQMIGRKRENECRDTGFGTTTHVIKIQHSLDGTVLQPVHDTPCLGSKIFHMMIGFVSEFRVRYKGWFMVVAAVFEGCWLDILVVSEFSDPRALGRRSNGRIREQSRRRLRSWERCWHGGGWVIEFGILVDVGQSKCQRDNGRDMCFRTINVCFQSSTIRTFAQQSQSFLIIGTGTSHPQLNTMCFQFLLSCPNRLYESLKGSRNIGKISNRTTNDPKFGFATSGRAWRWWFVSRHELNEGGGILVRGFGAGCTGIFTVIGQFVSVTEIGHCIGISNARTTSSHHGPYASVRIQYSQFERCTGFGIQFTYVRFFRTIQSSKGWWKIQGTPNIGTQKCGRFI